MNLLIQTIKKARVKIISHLIRKKQIINNGLKNI